MQTSESQKTEKTCIIWMHGLGADAQDMHGLSTQLKLPASVSHICLDAPVRPVTLNNNMPMRAWYDITGMQLTDREDATGILQSEALILSAIDKQLADGFQHHCIFLAGFSQGGAMALFTALRLSERLGGIIALSSYLPLVSQVTFAQPTQTPIFSAGGLHDPMVLPAWTKMSVAHMQEKGYQAISMHEYSMEHAICYQEVVDLSAWISSNI